MGEAKARGTFEERKAQAIARREVELVAERKAQAERRAADDLDDANRARRRTTPSYPLAVALIMANSFVFQRRPF